MTPTTTSLPAPETPGDRHSGSGSPDPGRSELLACIARLPVEWRAGQVLMPAVYGDQLARAQEIVGQYNVGGALIRGWPSGAGRGLLAPLKGAAAVPVMVAVDEEGGRVQPLRTLGDIPGAQDAAATLTADGAGALVVAHARNVAGVGIDVVFGPVVDVAPPGWGSPFDDRLFSSDPTTVTAFGRAYVEAWRSAGVLPVLKHFPGHGSASGDTHNVAATTPHLTELEARDLVPYRDLAGTGAGVMVGHLDVPGLTDGDSLPSSLSPNAIDGLLRVGLGYDDALVFTDALNMDAIANRYDLPAAAVMALAAGNDVLVYVQIEETGRLADAIVTGVNDGTLPSARLDESVLRILRHKHIDPCTIAP